MHIYHDTQNYVIGNPNAQQIGGWIIDSQDVRKGEPPIYLNSNASKNAIDGLILTAKRENFTCASCPHHQQFEFTSGKVTSWGPDRKVNYGYVEAEIKTTDEYGMWPALWLWETINVAANLNVNEEIDIFEMIPGTE